MDFALLPPEVNSARMYTGPGAGSLLAAAGGWDSLAAELATTAEAYGSVLSGLAALHWRGPAAESMAVTAAPYIGGCTRPPKRHSKQRSKPGRQRWPSSKHTQ